MADRTWLVLAPCPVRQQLLQPSIDAQPGFGGKFDLREGRNFIDLPPQTMPDMLYKLLAWSFGAPAQIVVVSSA